MNHMLRLNGTLLDRMFSRSNSHQWTFDDDENNAVKYSRLKYYSSMINALLLERTLILEYVVSAAVILPASIFWRFL
jgi:hypothetical protein